MANVFFCIYCLPLKYVYILIITLLVFWCGTSVLLRPKIRKAFNFVCFSVAFFAVVYRTLISRTPCSSYYLILTPLSFLKNVKIQPELYRSMLMNAFLFLPPGLSLPFILPEKLKLKPLISITMLFFSSLIIEFLQYKLSLGNVETDDIIFNTLGAAVGAVAYAVCFVYERRLKNAKAE